MKIGAHVAALQPNRKAPYDEGFENAARLGLDGVELIAMDVEELDTYYTADRCRRFRQEAERNGLVISQFALFSTACEGMASLDPQQKKEGLAALRRAVAVCAELGCGIVNLVSHWPVGLASPHAYPPSYIYPVGRGMMRTPHPKLAMRLPEPFDFDAIWTNYVDSLRRIADACAERGLTFAIEGHAHVIVSGADAMLRLFDQVPSDALGVNFDTSWHAIQREYLPMSIRKLGRRIVHAHLRDADGAVFYGAPVGQGVIDWLGVVRALQAVGYDGFLSFEYGGFDDYLAVVEESRDYMRRILEKAA